MLSYKKKFFLSLLTTIFVSSIILSSIFIPQRVAAMPTFDAATVIQTAKDIYSDVKKAITYVWEQATELGVTTALLSGVDMFAQKFANNAAKQIAKGASGQKSFFRGKGWETAAKDAAGAAAGDVIGTLSEPWKKLGFDICDPSLDIKVAITGSLIKSSSFEIEEPKCSWKNITKNWSDFKKELQGMTGKGATESVLAGLQSAFSPSNSAFSIAVRLNDRTVARSKEKKESVRIGFLKSDFMPKTNVAGTRVLTGAGAIEDIQKTALDMPVEAGKEKSKIISAIAKNKGAAILARALLTFSNTLVAESLNNALVEGLHRLSGKSGTGPRCGDGMANREVEECDGYNIPASCSSLGYIGGTLKCTNSCTFDVNLCIGESGSYTPREFGSTGTGTGTCGNGVCDGDETMTSCPQDCSWPGVELVASELSFTAPGFVADYDPLADFVICPDQQDIRTINSCVMSQKFYSALRAEPITVQTAIELKLIDPNLPLYSQDKQNSLGDAQKICYKDALCYSNLQKLRLLRVIPLGWEIAASISPVTDPVSIGYVTSKFSEDDPAVEGYEYRRLIDPDWLLKAPIAQCRALGFGPKLQAKLDVGRSEVCVDVQTCLRQDDDGNCLSNAWGYCTREQNIWRFGGEQCNSAYASCRAYSQGQETNYYIKDSLDFCTADEVGCQWYGTAKRVKPSMVYDNSPQVDYCGSFVYLYDDDSTVNEFCRQQGYDAGERILSGDVESTCKYRPATKTWAWDTQNIVTKLRCFSNQSNWSESEKIYLNAQANSCNAQDAGCSELIKVEPGVNLVYNGGFETWDSLPVGYNNWGIVAKIDNDKVSGDYSLKLTRNAQYNGLPQEIITEPSGVSGLIGKNLTVSFYAKKVSSGDDTNIAGVRIRFCDNESGCSGQYIGTNIEGDITDISWTRISQTVIVPDNAVRLRIHIYPGTYSSSDTSDIALFDNIQVELGDELTEYEESDLLPALELSAGTLGTGELLNLLFLQSDYGIPDAIGLKVFSNFEHQSPSDWYQDNIENPGAPASILVGGYSALQEGRSTYINAANKTGDDIYTNIFILSYTQDANSNTQEIFTQLYDNWTYNSNISSYDERQKLINDTHRWEDLRQMQALLANYYQSNVDYPDLSVGTYRVGTTVSVWDSWQNTLAVELGDSLPVDPINSHGQCPANYDPITCWNPASQHYTCPLNSYVYKYDYVGGDYYLNSNFEYDGVTWKDSSNGDLYIEASNQCDNVECTDSGCLSNF